MKDEWEVLIEAIERGRVVPVVGKRLLKLPDSDKLLYDILAEKLQHNCRVELEQGMSITLNNVALESISGNYDSQYMKADLHEIVSSLDYNTPKAINLLADIHFFRLYISTTFDELLQKDLEFKRGQENIRNVVNHQNKELEDIVDLDDPTHSKRTVVYQMFGKSHRIFDYAVTDGDILEYVNEFSSKKSSQSPNLNERIRRSQLLFIGCDFPNWLNNFFVRSITNEPLDSNSQPHKYFAENALSNDNDRVFFLSKHKGTTFDLSPSDFVEELHRRLSERGMDDKTPFKRSIFLSFVGSDRKFARELGNLVMTLDPNIEVFVDEEVIRPADRYNEVILSHIKSCSIFVPLISQDTVRRYLEEPNMYVRKEWAWAKIGREDVLGDSGLGGHRSFIMPLIIDSEVRAGSLSWSSKEFGHVSIAKFSRDQLSEIATMLVSTIQEGTK